MAYTKKKILVVDDERAILKVLSIKLKISGYDVVTALSGEEALELVTSAGPDIMLLDVIMPVVDGFEVLQKLRPSSQLPVIVSSARPARYTVSAHRQEIPGLLHDFLIKHSLKKPKRELGIQSEKSLSGKEKHVSKVYSLWVRSCMDSDALG